LPFRICRGTCHPVPIGFGIGEGRSGDPEHRHYDSGDGKLRKQRQERLMAIDAAHYYSSAHASIDAQRPFSIGWSCLFARSLSRARRAISAGVSSGIGITFRLHLISPDHSERKLQRYPCE
jgi:hypothetical protein